MGDGATVAALALAGGFLFVDGAHAMRYLGRRAEGQRLLFYSTVAAIALVILARLALRTFFLFSPNIYGGLREDFWSFVPGASRQPWLATAILAFVFGPTGKCLLNHVVTIEEATDKAISEHGKELEKLLLAAMRRKRLVLLALKGGKVYIGTPVEIPPVLEGETQYIRILPQMSGYRKETTFELAYTTQYSDAYEAIASNPELELEARDFEVVIPASEIVTAHLFSLLIDQDLFHLPVAAVGPTTASAY